MNISNVNFAHMCFAGATMTGTATIASLLGHTSPDTIIHVCVTVVAMLALAPIYADFK